MPKPMAPRPRKAIFSGIFELDFLGSRDVYCSLNGVNPESGAGCITSIEEKVV